MRLTMAVVSLVAIGVVAFASEGQNTGRGTPPPLIIESMSGQDSFLFYCAPCHGRGGKGDGPVASALRTPPADLTSLARRNAGTFPRSTVISFVTGAGRPLQAHGSSDMPVWGPIFRALDPSDTRVKVRIENIVAFIESIQIK